MSSAAQLASTKQFRQQGGPPLAPLATISLLLLLGGVVTSAALGGVLPSPFGDPAEIERYFAQQPDAVWASAVFGFASSVPLSIYAATVNSRLRTLGVTAPGATIALAGGLIGAGMLSLSGLVQWVLARPAVRTEAPVVHALQGLAFLTGGVAHVVFLGLLIAGIAVPGLLLGLLPRSLAISGLAIAVVAEIATVSLIWPGAAVLLPVARFPGLIWLVLAGALLPRQRTRRTTATDPR